MQYYLYQKNKCVTKIVSQVIFATVRGSSTSAREGLMPLAAEMDTWLKEPSKETYIGYAEDLGNGC